MMSIIFKKIKNMVMLFLEEKANDIEYSELYYEKSKIIKVKSTKVK